MKDCSKLILDASVALKWFLEEPDSVKADELQELIRKRKLEVWVPSLFYFEVANILSKRSPAHATEFISLLKMFELKEVPLVLGILGRAVKLVQKHPKIALYDAYYHAIALQSGAIFLTADEKYYKQAKSERNILLFKDWENKS